MTMQSQRSDTAVGLMSSLDNVVLWTCPGAEKNTRFGAGEVSKVQDFVHARRAPTEEIESVLELYDSSASRSRLGQAGRTLRTRGEASSSQEIEAAVDDQEREASCRRHQIPAVLTSMESRDSLRQRLAWDFRSLDEECTGRLPLHRCVMLFATNLGSKFSKRVWNDFRAQQVKQLETIGDLGGACLDDIRTAVVNAAEGKPNELGLTPEEVRQLIQSELEESQRYGVSSYRGLEEAITSFDVDTAKVQRKTKGQELRAAAEKHLVAFRALALTASTDDGLGRDEADSRLASSFSSSILDASNVSLMSLQSGESFIKEQKALGQSQSVWEVLEAKYDTLSLKLLESTLPQNNPSSSNDVAVIHADVMRLLRAGRLDEIDKQLTNHSSTADVSMLLGPAEKNHPTQLASGNDFLSVSTANRSLAELHLRQSKERAYLNQQIEGKKKVSHKALMQRLQLQKSVANAEKGFHQAAILMGLMERNHRPGTLNRCVIENVYRSRSIINGVQVALNSPKRSGCLVLTSEV